MTPENDDRKSVRKKKPDYETPIMIPLGGMEAAFGDCSLGSANPTQCNVGTQAGGGTGQCNVGFSPGGACEVGNSAPTKCENGSSANFKCETGSAAVGKCDAGAGQIR